MPQSAKPMRVHRLSSSSYFARCGLVPRTVLLAVTVVAAVLLAVFLGTRKTVDTIINDATARNSRIQAHSLGYALGQMLAEARNQLLVLAAGSMEKQDMTQRMQFRTKMRDNRYRELAFMDASRKNAYLLLSHNGEIITLNPEQIQDIPGSPFRTPGHMQRPDQVLISPPTEVVYPMMRTASGMQSQLALHVIRFSTQVFGPDGAFAGILTLSIDLEALRGAFTSFLATGHDAELLAGAEQLRAVYIDTEGWMVFQNESQADAGKPLRLDAVRVGFHGDFGRAGFSGAFRPGSDNYSYWGMMNDIQHGKNGQFSSWLGSSWGDGSLPVETVSYAPVTYQTYAGGPVDVVGGVAVLDSTFTTTRTGTILTLIYAGAFAAAILAVTALLWAMARGIAKPLQRLEGQLREEAGKSIVDQLPQADEPREVAALRRTVNVLLDRLHFLEQDRDMADSLANARLQLEPVKNFPRDVVLPADGIVGTSLEIAELKRDIAQAAKVTEDVLVVGETGTGKELVSRAIHEQSRLKDGPFITINCGALDESLLMDTLFGHVKGAFTEAKQARKGAFLAAEGGTLMLDEIGTASLRVQQALLRALSDRAISPLGSDEFIKFNTRVVAATNADLREEVHLGNFREDLFFRLAVITIRTPPLRQHKADIPLMISAFMKEGMARAGLTGPLPDISRGALSQLMHYHWPGNVRELRNCIFRTLTFCEGGIILQRDLQTAPDNARPDGARAEGARGKAARNGTQHPESRKDANAAPDGSAASGGSAATGDSAGSDATTPADESQAKRRDSGLADSGSDSFCAWPDASHGSAASAKEHVSGLDAEQPQTDPASSAGASEAGYPRASAGAGRGRKVRARADSGADSREESWADSPAAGKAGSHDAPRPAPPHHDAGDSLQERRLKSLLPEIASRGTLTRKEYQELAGGVSMRTAQYDLQMLVNQGLLEKQGRGPALRYVYTGGDEG